MTPALSVVVCTHNPRAEYLRRCLAGLEAQTLPRNRWELLIVDNASAPAIAPDLSWHPHARIVREDTLGLTPARLRGIRETIGDLLVFADDDNVLDADYLERASDTAATHPFLGAWSGQCRPAFDEPPPDWTRRYWGNLVIREFDRDVWSNLPRLPQSMPCGAGLCIRRAVAAQYVVLYESGKRPFQLDRRGDMLLSGGDNDLAACACDVGLGVGLIAALKLTHLIPPGRLQEDYLARLIESIAFSSVVLAHLRSSWAELASAGVRWHEPLRVWFLERRHRRMQRASIQGRRRGLAFVKTLPPG